jgi:hypothetical protein
MAAAGYSPEYISEKLGWEIKKVVGLIKSKLGQAEIRRLNTQFLEPQHAEIAKMRARTAAYGAGYLDDTLKNEETPRRDRIHIAERALEDTGNVAPKKQVGVFVKFTPEDLADVRKRAMGIEITTEELNE